ncbi:Putative DNA-3-methyladenine glycosylase yfjP [Termitomyces sp. J132]|nr:Putative DNA-3-methyladenine glycosylase yfjP [Termitomyces sp. J132]
MVPASLTFSFEEGKKHLISVDHRFQDLFSKMPCKPFEQLEMVHPFRALATSIIGQQISWFAARSVNHKFVRLFEPSIPEKIEDYAGHGKPTSFYPSPELIARTDIATLRTAGLSQRKAEYVLDLAQRFADGRLSTDKLINANDEELARMLIEVRGIGRWTVDMFAIFSLRRPDILPVGDLGVQRGLAVWFLSLHSPKHNWGWTPHSQKKSAAASSHEKEKPEETAVSTGDTDMLPVIETNTSSSNVVEDEDTADDLPSLPPAFTPSIKNTLKKPGVDEGSIPISLPEGITVESLKSRLNGKNKVKGAILTPKEMEDLTERWKPYRSLGVYYMWSIADVPS